MGMFDQRRNFTDHIQEGEVFNLVAASVTTIDTAEYGERQMAVLTVADENGRNRQQYGLYGDGVVSQVERMEDGDLPKRVRVERAQGKGDRQVKLLVPEGLPVPGTEDDGPGF